MSSVSQQGLCKSHAQQTGWNTPPSVLTLMFCIFTHLSVYRNPGVLFFFFFMTMFDLILLCAPSYFCFLLNFTWLKSSRCCFSNHMLFTCALIQRVGWECADVYSGLRCEISSEASSVSQIRNHLEWSLYLLVYYLCYRKSRLTENVQNIKQWMRMRLFINGANVRIMHRFLSNSSHLNTKPSKWSQWRKKVVPSDSLFPQSAAKPKVSLMNMELSSISGLHVSFIFRGSNCTLP